jgi:hypothetical protein
MAIWRIGVVSMALLCAFTRVSKAQTTGPSSIAGAVVDQTGGALVGTQLELLTPSGNVVRSVTTDSSGTFRFEAVPPGTYDIRAALDGFRTTTTRVRVAATSAAQRPLRVTMPLATVEQEITVSNVADQVNTRAENNLDAVSIDQQLLGQLPMLDQDYLGSLSHFLDASAVGTGGPTIVVNGMEVSSLNVPASAVQQIKINQDPYSAEYSRPGRGRIEILTKPGSQTYTGEFDGTYRSGRFNARNAFAGSRSTEQRQLVDATLGGPVGHGGRTSFFLSTLESSDDQQATVLATTNSGPLVEVVTQPTRRVSLSASVIHQRGNSNTFSIRPAYQYESSRNRGVGGRTLASAGTNFEHREEQLTYLQQTVFSATVLNQFQLLVGEEREPTRSVSPLQAILVNGAFIGGGAQVDLLRTERHFQLTQSLAWTIATHFVQFGVQVPDWSRRGFEDRSNFGGTFSFANLDAFEHDRPYAFVQQRGNGVIAPVEKLIGAYVKDSWQAGKQLSISYGVRYDWQNFVTDHNNVAPRISLAYALRNSNILRGGAGLFFDRTGPIAIADTLQSRPGGLQRVVLTNPDYPDPFATTSFDQQPLSVTQFATGMKIPYAVQYSLAFEHQLQKSTTVSITYSGAKGVDLFRSRDINAPAPSSAYRVRPDARYGAIRQIESTGRQRSDSIQAMLRGRVTRWFSGQMLYTFGHANNDTGGIGSFPANDYDLAAEWSRADFDRRHRFALLGRITATHIVDIGASIATSSGVPYTELLGIDLYNNGRGGARPVGVGRNTLQSAGNATVDVRLSRDVKIHDDKKKTLAIGADVFNAFNRVNFTSYEAVVTSPLFGRPLTASAPRQAQLSVRYRF